MRRQRGHKNEMYYKNKNYGKVVTIVFAALLLSAIALPVCDARELKELHIGYLPCMHQIAEMMAMEKGWWGEELSAFGIENVTDTAFSSGQSEMSAMMAGELDIAYVGTAPPITAIDRGLDAKIVAGVQNNGSDLVLLPELAAAYTSPEDLNGLKIATLPQGSIQYTLIVKWLRDNGLNDEEVEIVEMSPRDALSAIGEREIEGAFLPAPSLTVLELERERKVERIVHSGEMWPNHACCCLLVRGELIREHPELVEQIIRIHINATEYVNEHPDEAAELYAKIKGDELERVKESFERCDAEWIHDPHRQIRYGIEYARVNYELGLTDKLLTADDLYDTRLYDTIMMVGPPTPGFEALFAITAAVLSVAYLMRRRGM
jgi:NitT/TauT family transport system substrate-binding protein